MLIAMAVHTCIKRVMLITLSIWLMQVSSVYASININSMPANTGASAHVMMQHHQMINSLSSLDQASIAVTQLADNTSHPSCDMQHCAACAVVLMNLEIQVDKKVLTSLRSSERIKSILTTSSSHYRPPQFI